MTTEQALLAPINVAWSGTTGWYQKKKENLEIYEAIKHLAKVTYKGLGYEQLWYTVTPIKGVKLSRDQKALIAGDGDLRAGYVIRGNVVVIYKPW